MSHRWLKWSQHAGVKHKTESLFLIIAQSVWDLLCADTEGAKTVLHGKSLRRLKVGVEMELIKAGF